MSQINILFDLLTFQPNLKIGKFQRKTLVVCFLFVWLVLLVWFGLVSLENLEHNTGYHLAYIPQMVDWRSEEAALHFSTVPTTPYCLTDPKAVSYHRHHAYMVFSGGRELFILILPCNITKKNEEQIESIVHLQENGRKHISLCKLKLFLCISYVNKVDLCPSVSFLIYKMVIMVFYF